MAVLSTFAVGCGRPEANLRLEGIIERQEQVLARVPTPPPSIEALQQQYDELAAEDAKTIEVLRSDTHLVRAALEDAGCTVTDDGGGGASAICLVPEPDTDVAVTDALYRASLATSFYDLRVTDFGFSREKHEVFIRFIRLVLPLPSISYKEWPAAPTLDEIEAASHDGGRWDLFLRARGLNVKIREGRETIEWMRAVYEQRSRTMSNINIAATVREAAIDVTASAFDSVVRGNTIYVDAFSFHIDNDLADVSFAPRPGQKQLVLERFARLPETNVQVLTSKETVVTLRLKQQR